MRENSVYRLCEVQYVQIDVPFHIPRFQTAPAILDQNADSPNEYLLSLCYSSFIQPAIDPLLQKRGFGAQTHKFVKQRDASNDIDNDDDEINNVNTGTAFVLENIDPALRVFAEDMLGVQIDSPAGNAGSSLQGASGVESMATGCISL